MKKLFLIIGLVCLLPLFAYAKDKVDPALCNASEPMSFEYQPPKKVTHHSLKGIYITINTLQTARLTELVDTLIANDGNTIVVDIEHGGGQLGFIPENEWLKNLNSGSLPRKTFETAIENLHEKGIYVIARQVVFNDPYMNRRHPEWRIKYRSGGEVDTRWLDPSKPGVHRYNLKVLEELIDMDFDEIQFDYIRFPAFTHSAINYHYDEENFERYEIINDFLQKAKNIAVKKNVPISADVFGVTVWGDIDWKILGQNIGEMAKIVDAIYPMTYPSHFSPGFQGYMNPYGAPYNIMHDSIEKFVTLADGNAEIRPWIQGFPLKIPRFGTWFMKDQIQASLDAGANDFIIWSPGNIYTYSWATFKDE